MEGYFDMKYSSCVFALAVSVVGLLSSSTMGQSTELTEARYKQLCSELRSSENELWRTIPWKIDLLDAQQLAASENKPIFIWAMDGHPLGCT